MKTHWLLAVALVALVALAALAANAAEPGKPEGTTGPTQLPPSPTTSALSFPEQMISGTVTDAADKPLAAVAIKLFAGGNLVQATHTNSSGAFELKVPLNLDRDETVVLWLISTTEPLVPQTIVLKQSGAAHSAGLFSACTREVKMRSQMRVDVKLLTEGEVLASIKGKGCL